MTEQERGKQGQTKLGDVSLYGKEGVLAGQRLYRRGSWYFEALGLMWFRGVYVCVCDALVPR